MVPTCPFPDRLAPFRTTTDVPIRASRDSKKFTPCRSLFETRPELQPQKRFPFPEQIDVARRYIFLCIPGHFVSGNTTQVRSTHAVSDTVLTRSTFASVMD